MPTRIDFGSLGEKGGTTFDVAFTDIQLSFVGLNWAECWESRQISPDSFPLLFSTIA
jgi:hypothetical protein